MLSALHASSEKRTLGFAELPKGENGSRVSTHFTVKEEESSNSNITF